ncbi:MULTISPECIES: hypothetical protein [Pseudomonas]|uniref:hypothetical protein n=1 Tax=Pseudomonas TaxID=286 RepID=UPI002117AB53|nr:MULTISPECIES: hypothetical protein [Pseudomonas]
MSGRLIDVISNCATKQIQLVLDEVALSLSPELLSIDGLKQVILEDPFVEVIALGKGRFKAVANNGSLFKEAVLRDFYCGYIRVRAQYETLKSLKAAKIAPPWDLTTAYYCAFFSAIELLRLQGTYQVSFDGEDYSSLLGKCLGDVGFLENSQNYTGRLSSCGEEIVFSSSASRPHQAVWRNLHEVITQPMSARYPDWKELHTLNLIFSGKRNWSRPSDVRNNWNYARSEFYSALGQPLAAEFYSLIDNSSSACQWLERSMSIPPSVKSHATSVAVVCEVLSSSVMSAYSNLTPATKITTRIPSKQVSRRDRRRNKKLRRKNRSL